MPRRRPAERGPVEAFIGEQLGHKALRKVRHFLYGSRGGEGGIRTRSTKGIARRPLGNEGLERAETGALGHGLGHGLGHSAEPVSATSMAFAF